MASTPLSQSLHHAVPASPEPAVHRSTELATDMAKWQLQLSYSVYSGSCLTVLTEHVLTYLVLQRSNLNNHKQRVDLSANYCSEALGDFV